MVASLLELILTKKTLMFLKLSIKYLDTLNNKDLLLVLVDHLLNFMKEFKKRLFKTFYKNELDEVCFAHDAAYSDSKDLAERSISDKVLKDRADKTAGNHKYDEYQKALANMAYKFFDKKQGQK